MTTKRLTAAEKSSFAIAALIFAGTIALYVNEIVGPDIDGVNPLVFVAGLGATILLVLIPLVGSRRRRVASRSRD